VPAKGEPRDPLPAESELADEFVIPLDVSTLEVVEQALNAGTLPSAARRAMAETASSS
jgi:hypothetical protein